MNWRITPGLSRHAVDAQGYPNMDFEEWFQQGLACYTAALPRRYVRQSLHALAARWKRAGRAVRLWHLRAFALGVIGQDGHLPREVPDDYQWPEPPDPSWILMVCVYPDGLVDLDFAHPVSRRFWSEDNGYIEGPEKVVGRYTAQWYERMGFEVMRMTPYAKLAQTPPPKHLRQV